MKRTIKVDCDKDVDIEEILADVFEKVKGGYNCNFSYAKHATKMKEAGIAKSTNEAAGMIAIETGESPEAVRHKIRRGSESCIGQDGQDVQAIEITEMEEKNQENEITDDDELESLYIQIKRRIRFLKKNHWNCELRGFVLEKLHELTKITAKK